MTQETVLKHTQHSNTLTQAPACSREQRWLWQYAEQYPLLKNHLEKLDTSATVHWVIETVDFMQANSMHKLRYDFLQELYFHAPDDTALAFRLADVIDDNNLLIFTGTEKKEKLLVLYKMILATAMAADNTTEIKKAQERYSICLFKYSATVDELIHSIPIIIDAVKNNQDLLQLDILRVYYEKLMVSLRPHGVVEEDREVYGYERVLRDIKTHEDNRRDFGEGVGVEMQDVSLPPKKTYQELRTMLLEHELSSLGF